MKIDWKLDAQTGWMYVEPKNTENVNMKGKLTNLIESVFKQSTDAYKLQLQLIHDLRNESLASVVAFEEISLAVVIKLKKYVVILKQLIRQFPDDIIEFKWNGSSVNSLNIEYEYAMYQLLSYYSILAVTEDSIERSGIYFQYCAGFMKILKFDYTIMLAQAQEVYYIKAIRDGMKESVLVKLCQQISQFYKMYDVSDYYVLKETYYKCLAYFHYSNTCHNKGKFHDEKAYILEILKLLDDSKKDSDYCKVLSDIQCLKLKVLEISNRLDKNLIVGVIKDLPSTQLVKCIIGKEIDEEDEHLFPNLVPLDKVTEISDYEVQLLNFVETELTTPIILLDKKLEHELEVINLDTKIDQLLNHIVPDILTSYQEELIRIGSYEKLHSLNHELNQYKYECRKELDFVKSLNILHNERNETIIKSFEIYERYMENSVDSDRLISTQISQLTPFLRILMI